MLTTIGLFIVIGALIASNTVILVYVKRYIEGEDQRAAAFFDTAMSYLKASSLESKVKIDAEKAKLEVDLQAYRDAVAQSEAQLEKAPAPVFVKTSDGREIDLRDWEVQ